MIDFHCHLLYGVDDGPEEIDESVEMAFALQRAGFTAVYCTPHLMKGVHDTEHQKCMHVLETLRQKLIEEKIALQLYLGREYYLDEFIFEHLKNPLPLEETKYILLEIPDNIPYKFVKQACFEIRRHGFIPMIAHPERGRLFELLEQNEKKETNRLNPDKKTYDLELMDYLQDLGCAFQGNYGSFLGLYGRQPQKTANFLTRKNFYTHFGTDLHSREGIRYLESKEKDRLLSMAQHK